MGVVWVSDYCIVVSKSWRFFCHLSRVCILYTFDMGGFGVQIIGSPLSRDTCLVSLQPVM